MNIKKIMLLLMLALSVNAFADGDFTSEDISCVDGDYEKCMSNFDIYEIFRSYPHEDNETFLSYTAQLGDERFVGLITD